MFPDDNILSKIISNISKWLFSYISTGMNDLIVFGIINLIKSVTTSIAFSKTNWDLQISSN